MATIINADTSDGLKLTSDTSGEIQFQSAGVVKAKVTANGLQDANGNSLRGGSFRNLIINGDMQIAQRGTSVAGITGAGYYTLDRWETRITTSGTWTMTQDADVPLGQGFASSMKFACTTANASLPTNSAMRVGQHIEAQNLQHLKYGTSNAEKVTLSFWVKSNKIGTYNAWTTRQDSGRMSSKQFTISSADTWEKKTLTFDGDTTGTIANDNGRGMEFNIVFAAGTDYTSGTSPNGTWQDLSGNDPNRYVGNVNLADSTSNYINITGWQLEIGSGASDFEFLPYDVQLARCERYYQVVDTTTNAYSSVGATGFPYRVTMRTAPTTTFSYSGTANRVYNVQTGAATDLSSVTFNTSVSGFSHYYTFTPTNWAGSAGNGFRTTWAFSAEL